MATYDVHFNRGAIESAIGIFQNIPNTQSYFSEALSSATRAIEADTAVCEAQALNRLRETEESLQEAKRKLNNAQWEFNHADEENSSHCRDEISRCEAEVEQWEGELSRVSGAVNEIRSLAESVCTRCAELRQSAFTYAEEVHSIVDKIPDYLKTALEVTANYGRKTIF